MGLADTLTLLVTHPQEFRTLVNYWLWYEGKRDITAIREHPTSGWDRENMRQCWAFLDLTSRTFAAVVKELEGDLARTVCLFYLVLRGLDTIEDDMTLADDVKQPLMRAFDVHCITPGWRFTGSGPAEKDRALLVDFQVVVAELALLDPAYRAIILDITRKMQNGMADYAHTAATASGGAGCSVNTLADFDVYCHYVAGVVGEGLSRLFAASGLEGAHLADQLALSNAMGLLLQKTNILRDVHEDAEEARLFWPREVWAAHGFTDLRDVCAPAHRERGMWVLSAMTLDALGHAVDALEYLALLKNQSVFNFCAIPQTMAMATLALCFMNPAVLERNVKIRKAEAVQLILSSGNPRDVAYLFRDYARAIHAKASPADPSFVALCVACARVEAWTEHHYPSFVRISPGGGKVSLAAGDARARIVEREKGLMQRARAQEYETAIAAHEERAKVAPKSPLEMEPPYIMFLLLGLMFIVLLCLAAGMVYLLVLFDVFGEVPHPQHDDL